MSSPFGKPTATGGSFLPSDYVEKKAEFRANLITLLLFAVVMAGVVGAFIATQGKLQRVTERHQQAIEAYKAEAVKMEQLKALEAQRAAVLEKAEITAALVERVPRWTVLAELTLRMPLEMRRDLLTVKSKRIEQKPVLPPAAQASTASSVVKTLTGSATKQEHEKPKVLPPKFEYQLTLAGTAERNNNVADYIASLKGSPVLNNVELEFIREAKEGEDIVRKFQIVASVATEVDAKAISDSLINLVKKREETLAAKSDKSKSSAPKSADANAQNGG